MDYIQHVYESITFSGEDDDLWNRVAAAGLKVSRYPEKIAR